MVPSQPVVGSLTAFLTAAWEGLCGGGGSQASRVVSISKLPLNAQVGKWHLKLSHAAETDQLGFNSRDRMPNAQDLQGTWARMPSGLIYHVCAPLPVGV